jgi:RHS repeat-associated protein
MFGIANYKDNNRNETFAYDSLNRLLSAQNAGTDCNKVTLHPPQTQYWGNSYAYDSWGNLKQKNVTKCWSESLSISVGSSNRVTDFGYMYDAAGNMTSDATDSVSATYDSENRIATATSAGVTTAYTYDDEGHRAKKSSGSAGTLYWVMNSGIIGESDLVGTMKSEYIFFNGERLARRDGVNGANGISYYFSDHLKTVAVIGDSTGHIKAESDYYPWGGELQLINNDSNHFKFTGKERDSESAVDYFGARYYSNALGRFITADWSPRPVPVPYSDLQDPQTLNLYGYVRNNPLSKIDPDGHGGCNVDNETHGTVWCWLHKHGIVKTQKEQADIDRAELNKQGVVFFDKQGNRVDLSKMPDAQVIRLYDQFQNDEIPSLASAVFMTQWGWSGSKAYRDAVKQLKQPGTHENLGGKVPTQDEAVQMIEESGGSIDRIEEGHGPESVSSHKGPHINYTTASGDKATIIIQAVTH